MKTKSKPSKSSARTLKYPVILQKYVDLVGDTEATRPRRLNKRFHNRDVTGWVGKVLFSEVRGYVENKRLKLYLNRWRNERGDQEAEPTTQEIYEIMLSADQEAESDDKKPFHLERLADNLVRNNMQEEIILHVGDDDVPHLWDGNRRFFASYHIQKSKAFENDRERLKWLPAFVTESHGEPTKDKDIQHAIITETNFVTRDIVPWPNYIKAEEIWNEFQKKTDRTHPDPVVDKAIHKKLAVTYGVSSRGKADPSRISRWIKMIDLAHEFKEYQVEIKHHDEDEAELKIAEYFEYFDELTRPNLSKCMEDADVRDMIFDWLWDKRLPSFAAVRRIPPIVSNQGALEIMQTSAFDTAFIQANNRVILDDPSARTDTRASDDRIMNFSQWLNALKTETYDSLTEASLEHLYKISTNAAKMLEAVIKLHKKGVKN